MNKKSNDKWCTRKQNVRKAPSQMQLLWYTGVNDLDKEGIGMIQRKSNKGITSCWRMIMKGIEIRFKEDEKSNGGTFITQKKNDLSC